LEAILAVIQDLGGKWRGKERRTLVIRRAEVTAKVKECRERLDNAISVFQV
jgi:hypothetical protein